MKSINLIPYTLLSSLGLTILLSVIFSIAFIVGGIFLGIFLHRRGFSHNLNSIKDKYSSYLDQLKTNCTGMINRIAVLAKSSKHFDELYQMRKEQYAIIIKEDNTDVLKETSTLDTYIKNKNYKAAKLQEKRCNEYLEKFVAKVEKLDSDLNEDLKEDQSTREACLEIKSTYREIKQFYNDHFDELSPISSSFDSFFLKNDEAFKKFDENLDKANYKECLSILPDVKESVDSLKAIIEDLPMIETLIDKVIPEKVKAISEEYNSLIEEKYILSYLSFDEKIKNINRGLESLNDKVKKFNIDKVSDTLISYQKTITDLSMTFEDEKSAKHFFDEKCSALISAAFELEKYYMQVVNQVESNKETYVVDKKYIDNLLKLKSNIEVISSHHRKLENLQTGTINEPYTSILKNMKFLQGEIDSTSEAIKVYVDYIQRLSNTAQNIFNNLEEYYLKLKEYEIVVTKDINVEVYTNQAMMTFDQLYKTIALIDSLLVTKPIDIVRIENIFDGFKLNCESIISDVKNRVEMCKQAESAIILANQYRIDFQDSRKYLDEAERNFNDGEFTKAKSNADKVLKMYSSNNI